MLDQLPEIALINVLKYVSPNDLLNLEEILEYNIDAVRTSFERIKRFRLHVSVSREEDRSLYKRILLRCGQSLKSFTFIETCDRWAQSRCFCDMKDDEFLTELAHKCPNITKFNQDTWRQLSKNESTFALEHFKIFRNLTEVNVDLGDFFCSSQDDTKKLSAYVSEPNRIISLKINGFYHHYLPLMTLVKTFRNIRRLFVNCRFNKTYLSEEDFRVFRKLNEHLAHSKIETLELWSVPDECLSLLDPSKVTGLHEYLEINNLELFSNLTHLSLDCKAKYLNIKSLPNTLKVLNIANLDIDDISQESFVELLATFGYKMRKLTVIRVVNQHIQLIDLLRKYCTRLKVLEIEFIKNTRNGTEYSPIGRAEIWKLVVMQVRKIVRLKTWRIINYRYELMTYLNNLEPTNHNIHIM